VLDFDQVLRSLGPYILEPAVFATSYENQAGELIVASTDLVEKTALSKHRLEQIKSLVRDLIPEDRGKLIETLQAAQDEVSVVDRADQLL
jgi:hypothetical protein